MKKRWVFETIVMAAAFVLSGCAGSKDVTEVPSAPESDLQTEDRPTEAAGDESAPTAADEAEVAAPDESTPTDPDENETPDDTDESEVILASVTVNLLYDEGTPDTIEMLDIGGVSGQPDESGHIISGYDEDGKLIYRREDTGFTDADGKLNVTISYDFYSLDHDFDLRFEPMEPENGGDIQSINGSVFRKSDSADIVEDFTWETVGIRGQTGIWYAGICSCRNGVLGGYE
ncbi:MAG: hypothetical protein IK115_06380 [Lachnospiraceae bacterium]|nr:hypothetical protein [Lachnospiraceae bacterium]